MGKAVVERNDGDGLYLVRLELDRRQAQRELNSLADEVATLGQQHESILDEIAAAMVVLEQQREAFNTLIQDPEVEPEQVLIALAEYNGALQVVKAGEARAAQVLFQIESLRKRANELQKLPENPLVSALCIDAQPDVTGTIGTIELAHETDPGLSRVWIKAGYESGAEYAALEDGIIAPRAAMSPAQVFFNAAILPGIQKWRPTYRIGRIHDILGDVCAVQLEPAQSSALGLDVNLSTWLTAVPIQYRECNGAAFEEDDRVVVKFAGDPLAPTVTGFADNPRLCGMPVWIWGRAATQNNLTMTSNAEIARKFTSALDSMDVAAQIGLGGQPFGSPAMLDACVADSQWYRLEDTRVTGYQTAYFQGGSANFANATYTLLGVASDGAEVFIIAVRFVGMDHPDNGVFVFVYSTSGSFLREFRAWTADIPPPEGRHSYLKLQTFGTLNVIDGRLYGMYSVRRDISEYHACAFCLTTNGATVWRREFEYATQNYAFPGSAGRDIFFIADRAEMKILALHTNTGATAYSFSPAEDSPTEYLMPETVSYTHDWLYVSGFARGTIETHPNDSIMLIYRMNRVTRQPEFVKWVHFDTLLGPPPLKGTGDYRTDNWTQLGAKVDAAALAQRLASLPP